jgi:hypothetical protein
MSRVEEEGGRLGTLIATGIMEAGNIQEPNEYVMVINLSAQTTPLVPF